MQEMLILPVLRHPLLNLCDFQCNFPIHSAHTPFSYILRVYTLLHNRHG